MASRRDVPGPGAVVARALARPINLLAGGAGIIAALVLSWWPLAVIGVVAYAALVSRSVRSPAFRKKALQAARASRVPDAPTAEEAGLEAVAIRDPALLDGAARVRHALAKLRRVLAEPHGEVLDDADLASRVDELARRAVRLVQNGEEVARYLGREDPAALQREIDRLEARAREAGDPATGKQWSDAAQAQREHRQVLAELAAAQDKVLANLSGIAASLDGLSAKVVRMGALDAQAQAELSGDVSSELSRLNSEVNAFEEVLQPLMAGRVSA